MNETDPQHHPDSVRMTFGEHLDELRSRLIRALLGLAAAAAVAIGFQERLFEFFATPYETARENIALEWAEQRAAEPPPPALPKAEDPRQQKLQDLILRLYGRGVLGDGDLQALEIELPADPRSVPRTGDIGPLNAVNVTEKFFAHIKVALLTAALLSAPLLLYQLWAFIGAGLYKNERKAVLKTLPFSLLLFAVGLTFGFTVLVPVSLHFLLSYGDPEVIRPTITVGSYLSLLFVLLFVMGLVFQVPLVMTVTTRMGLVTPKTFRQKRKFFLLGAFVFAALLTPPDYVTQVLVATPMVVLFELGIFLSMLVARRAQQRRNEDSAEESTA